jgi:UDP-N-acetylmuramoyl-tripeptide--D-alanyl-D-alanine ligase
MIKLQDILVALTGETVSAYPQEISGAVIDSRLVKPGMLFVALPGENTDGHQYVDEALAKGALAALIDKEIDVDSPLIDLRHKRFPDSLSIQPPFCLLVEDALGALQTVAREWRTKVDIRVIGVTGSVGKSTSKEVIGEVLQKRYRTVRNPGNLNNEIGLPLSLLSMSDAHERAVFEMGFYIPKEIQFLCEIALPQVGVVTNISQVHLERAGTMEAIVAGKSELVEALPPAPEGVAILNHDDLAVRGMAEKTQAKVFYYGLTEQADLWASDIEGLGLDGIRFVFHYQNESIYVRVPMLGRHSVHTALRAAAVGLIEGLTWEEIVNGLQSTESQLRLVAVQGPRGSLILDDTYNAAPPSVIAALNLLEDLEGHRVAVLGDMLELGEFEEQGHRMVGARAAQVVDELVTIGEKAQWIGEEALRAGLPKARVRSVESREQVVEHLRDRIGEEDVVLIKGSRSLRLDLIVSELEELK